MLFKSVVQDFIGKFGSQLISFTVSIFLARILSPHEFGIIGMAMAFIAVANVFVEAGFGAALVQTKVITKTTESSVFWLNIIVSLLFFLAFYLSAPYISVFYDADITLVVRVLSFIFIVNSFGIVSNNLLIRNMKFKKIAFLNFTSTLISGLIGLLFAYYKADVWALVAQTLSFSICYRLLLFATTKWVPQFILSIDEIKKLWRFGGKLLLSNLLITFFVRLDEFLIGKLFSATTLGYYTRAKSLNNLIYSNSSSSLSTVLFSDISSLQNDKNAITERFEMSMKMVSIIAFFLSTLFFISANDLILFLFGQKWLPSATYFRLLAAVTFTYPLSEVCIAFLKGMGHSNVILKAELPKKSILLIAYIVGFSFGIIQFLYAIIICRVLTLYINLFYLSRYVAFSKINILKILLTNVIISSLVISISDVLPFFNHNAFLNLIIYSLISIIPFLILIAVQNIDLTKKILHKIQ